MQWWRWNRYSVIGLNCRTSKVVYSDIVRDSSIRCIYLHFLLLFLLWSLTINFILSLKIRIKIHQSWERGRRLIISLDWLNGVRSILRIARTDRGLYIKTMSKHWDIILLFWKHRRLHFLKMVDRIS